MKHLVTVTECIRQAWVNTHLNLSKQSKFQNGPPTESYNQVKTNFNTEYFSKFPCILIGNLYSRFCACNRGNLFF